MKGALHASRRNATKAIHQLGNWPVVQKRDSSARREQLGRVFIAVKSVGDEVEGVNVHTHTQRQLTLKFLSPVGMTEAAGVRGDGDGLRQFLVETDYRTSWFATEGKGWHVQILYTHTHTHTEQVLRYNLDEAVSCSGAL